MVDDQVFADGIGTISMIGGTVRLDFLAYSPTQTDASGQPRAEFRQRVIMGLDAFLHAAEKIHEAAQALATRNIRQEPALVPPQPEQREAEVTPPTRVTALKPPFP